MADRHDRRLAVDDLIERLRAVKWEEVYDDDRMPDDPTRKCVLVDMRPDDFRALLREATGAQQPAEQHPDDAAVDRFAAAMKAKLKKKRQEGRAGWQFMASEQLSALLHEHVSKGDPVDVANLAMMLHQNGQVIEPPAAVVTDEMKETDLWRCTVCGRFGAVGRCCGEETRERANLEQLLTEHDRLRAEVEVWKASFEQAASGHATYAERSEQLEKVLRLAEEHINAITTDWYNAGQQVLVTIRDALSKEDE